MRGRPNLLGKERSANLHIGVTDSANVAVLRIAACVATIKPESPMPHQMSARLVVQEFLTVARLLPVNRKAACSIHYFKQAESNMLYSEIYK